MMERRFEHRPATRIDVRVHDRGGRVLCSPTRNLTANGAFIETGGVDLEPCGAVWVELPDSGAEGGWTRITAVVVHRHPDGVGVMFSRPYTALDRLGTPPPRRQAA